MLLGLIFLLGSHNYFHGIVTKLNQTAANEQARLAIGRLIVTDLHMVKSNFFELIPENKHEKKEQLAQQIDQLIARTGKLLGILEKGGVFHQNLQIDLQKTNNQDQGRDIHYSPPNNEASNYYVLKLRPMLPEVGKIITGLATLLQKRDTIQEFDETKKIFQIRSEIQTYLKNSKLLFDQLTDTGNNLLYDSDKRLQKINDDVAQLTAKFQYVETGVILIIFLTTFSLYLILARKILTINDQLQGEIHERKQAEKSISRAKQEWERTFDAVPDPIALLNKDHHIFRLNQAMADLIGKPVTECVGSYCYEVMHQTQKPPAYCPHSLLLADHKEHKTEQFLENINTFFEITVSPILNDEGDLFGSIHIARNITERKNAEKALQKANEELEQKVEERTAELKKFITNLKQEMNSRIQAEEALVHTQHQLLHAEKLSAVGKLSASIAHEFNNPLFAIMNILISIQQQETLSEHNNRMMDLAVQECNRMNNLTKSLQDFNRPTTGIPEPTDIHQVLDNMVLLCKKDFKDRKIEIVKRYSPTMPTIWAVTDQIRQVILNLLTNARDACQNGGQLTISTEAFVEKIRISIGDSGCGIAPDDLDKIFKPFFSTKQEFSGTGLGLAVCHGIVQKHNGSISVDSELEKGSIFTITLPIQPDDAQNEGLISDQGTFRQVHG